MASALLTAGPASAAAALSALVVMPTEVTVGQREQLGSLTIVNNNFGPEVGQSNILTPIRLAPSCGAAAAGGGVPCPVPDPGVFFVLFPFGRVGTACAGVSFHVSPPDSSGVVTLSSIGQQVVLGPAGTIGGSCTIDFGFNVLKQPAFDVNPNFIGRQTFTSAWVEGQTFTGLYSAAFTSTEVTVGRGTPTVATVATRNATAGTVAATATVTQPTGGPAPTGTVVFSLYGPGDATCSGPPLAVSANPVLGGSTATSDAIPVSQPGTYRYVASYSGDSNYVPVVTACNSPNSSLVIGREAPTDFDGNGTTDVSVFRPSTGQWGWATPPSATQWGAVQDIPASGDYNGDGKTETAVFRPSNGAWYIGGTSPMFVLWGQAGDVPVPADYDGNGTTDVAVYRPSNGAWYLRTPTPSFVQWGVAEDIPVPGDYDGNGTAEPAIYRPSVGAWYLRTPTPAFVQWGATGDIPVPADYDGNGTTDVAVFRPSTGFWYLRTAAPALIQWGQAGDVPVPGDYDGNGFADVAVFRPGNGAWYLRTTTPAYHQWGIAGDVPVPLPSAIYRRFF